MNEPECLARRLLGPLGSRGWWTASLVAEVGLVMLVFALLNRY